MEHYDLSNKHMPLSKRLEECDGNLAFASSKRGLHDDLEFKAFFIVFEALHDPKNVENNIARLEMQHEAYNKKYADLDAERLLVLSEKLLAVGADQDELLYIYYLAIHKGNATAAYYLSLIFHSNSVVERGCPNMEFSSNSVVELYWLREAANRGNNDAKLEMAKLLGWCIEEGESNPIMIGPAGVCYCAFVGYAPAQYHLAQFYIGGIGFKRDMAKALVWLEKAAEQNYTEAQLLLGTILRGDSEKTLVNIDRAIYWLKRASTLGNAIAGQELARMRQIPGLNINLRDTLPLEDQQKFDAMSKVKQNAWLQRFEKSLKGTAYGTVVKKKPEMSAEEKAKREAKKRAFKAKVIAINTKEREREEAIALINQKAQAQEAELNSILSLKTLDMMLKDLKISMEKIQVLSEQKKKSKDEIVQSILVNTNTIAALNEKRHDNTRSIAEWQTLDDLTTTKGDAVLEKMIVFGKLCSALKGIAAEEERTFSSRYKYFIALKMDLSKEVDETNIALRKQVCSDLKTEWEAILKEYSAFKAEVKKIMSSHQGIIERQQAADRFRDSKVKGKDEAGLKQKACTKAEIVSAVLPRAASEASGAQEALGSVCEVKNTVEASRVYHEEKRMNTAMVKALLADLASKAVETSEKTSHMKEIEQEALRKQVLGIRREVKAQQVSPKRSELSALLNLQLEQLDTIVKTLKGLAVGTCLSVKMQYALLGSLAEVCGIVKKEHTDPHIKEVARHLRNALYKSHQDIRCAFALLEMAEAWSKFLNTPEIAYFRDAAAVCNRVKLAAFNELYALGLNLKNKEKCKTIDLLKTTQVIQAVKKYWDMRQREDQKGLGKGELNTAADHFCWAILGSAVSVLRKSVTRQVPGAKNLLDLTLRSLELNYPALLEEFVTRGIVIRHFPEVVAKANVVPAIVLELSMSDLVPSSFEEEKGALDRVEVQKEESLTQCSLMYLADIEKTLLKPVKAAQSKPSVKFSFNPKAGEFSPGQ
jgi:hypothetical protein